MKQIHFSILVYLLVSFTSSLVALPHLSHEELAEHYAQLADHFRSVGNEKKAEKKYLKALESNPDNTHALVKLAHMYYERHDPEQAIAFYEHAIRLNHVDARMHFNLGLCYQQKDEWQKAAAQFNYTTELDPNHFNAHLYAGIAYEKINQFTRANMALKKAIDLNPESFEAWHHLGNLYRHIEHLEDAITCYKRAIKLDSNNVHVMMDLANAYNMLDQYEPALEWYKRILEKNPSAISALYNFGFTLKKMGKIDRALEIYQQVLAKKPDYAPVHFSLASIYLTRGDFQKGLEEYEWRWKAYNENPTRNTHQEWHGQPLNEKTLCVYAEQGLGDTLQFIRYLKLLKDRFPTSHIVFETQPALTPLLKLQPYIDHVIPRNEPLPAYDYYIHLMSIPYVLQTRLDSIPADIPYITPDSERVAFWHEHLSSNTSFKIGICWNGNARYSTLALRNAVAHKSIPLSLLKPLFDIENVTIYSLQKVDGLEQIQECDFKDRLICFDDDFDRRYGAFMDTAAVMKHLDLVITVDTGVAHLAGAMGIPTWIMLPYPADWRWLLDRTDTPWYPSVRLLRQPEMGDWHTPIQEAKHMIENQYVLQNNQPSHFPTNEQKQFFKNIIDSLS